MSSFSARPSIVSASTQMPAGIRIFWKKNSWKSSVDRMYLLPDGLSCMREQPIVWNCRVCSRQFASKIMQ